MKMKMNNFKNETTHSLKKWKWKKWFSGKNYFWKMINFLENYFPYKSFFEKMNHFFVAQNYLWRHNNFMQENFLWGINLTRFGTRLMDVSMISCARPVFGARCCYLGSININLCPNYCLHVGKLHKIFHTETLWVQKINPGCIKWTYCSRSAMNWTQLAHLAMWNWLEVPGSREKIFGSKWSDTSRKPIKIFWTCWPNWNWLEPSGF